MFMFLSSLALSLPFPSLTIVSRTNIVNMEKQELFLQNLGKTGTLSSTLLVFHRDIFYFRMACCEYVIEKKFLLKNISY